MAGRSNAGFSYSEQLGPEHAGRSVLEHLTQRHRHSDRAAWTARLCSGELDLDGCVARADMQLRAGQCLTWHRPPWVEPTVPLTFEVVHEDATLLVVNKPAGLPTLPGGGFFAHTLLTRVQARDPEWTPLHRLGRGTSGLAAFARGHAARSRLQGAFRTHEVVKRYLALATGQLAPQRVDVPIGPVPHARLGTVHAANAHGKASETVVEAVQPRGDHSLAEVRIHTGRPHQIRIHLAAAGHPLVGDPLYTKGGLPNPDALPGDGGYQLHAWRLALLHPTTGANLELEAPRPSALR